MAGVSGHAGLFANATDLAKLASVMLSGGYGENRFFSRNVIDLFTAPKSENAANWGLGCGDRETPSESGISVPRRDPAPSDTRDGPARWS